MEAVFNNGAWELTDDMAVMCAGKVLKASCSHLEQHGESRKHLVRVGKRGRAVVFAMDKANAIVCSGNASIWVRLSELE